MDTHWLGGPDFAVEILSPGDPAREKLDFYAKVNVRELLIIDRSPWQLDLYRLAEASARLGRHVDAGRARRSRPEVLPLMFRLVPDEPRPTIEVVHYGRPSRRSI